MKNFIFIFCFFCFTAFCFPDDKEKNLREEILKRLPLDFDRNELLQTDHMKYYDEKGWKERGKEVLETYKDNFLNCNDFPSKCKKYYYHPIDFYYSKRLGEVIEVSGSIILNDCTIGIAYWIFKDKESAKLGLNEKLNAASGYPMLIKCPSSTFTGKKYGDFILRSSDRLSSSSFEILYKNYYIHLFINFVDEERNSIDDKDVDPKKIDEIIEIVLNKL